MAESDPKKMRPFAQSPARRDFESEEDPLVELARIVSEDSGSYSSRSKSAPQSSTGQNAFSADLESELLQELESSFAPTVKRTPSVRAAATPKPLPADDADELLRSIEEQLGEFERRANVKRALAPAPASAPTQHLELAGDRNPSKSHADHQNGANEGPEGTRAADDEKDGLPEEAERLTKTTGDQPVKPAAFIAPPPRVLPPRREQRAGRAAGGVERIRPPERRNSETAPAPRHDEQSASGPVRGFGETPRRRPARSGFVSGAASGWAATENGQKGAASDETPRQTAPQVEVPHELRTTFGHFDELKEPTVRPDAKPAKVETELTHRLEPSYADPTFGGRWQEAEDPERDAATAEPEFVYAKQGMSGGSPLRAPDRRRTGRKSLVAALVLVVAVTGAGVAAYLRMGEDVASGPPPVIAAREGAVKVAAPQNDPASEGETVGEAVYNRVAGAIQPESDRVVDGAEEPTEIARIVPPTAPVEADIAPPSLAAEGEPIPEVPADDGATTSAGVDNEPAPVAAADPEALAEPEGTTPDEVLAPSAEDLPVGSRRVRTFVVRPDGTIAAADEARPQDPDTAPAEQQMAAASTASIVPTQVQTTAVDGADAPGFPETSFQERGEADASGPAPDGAGSAAGETTTTAPLRTEAGVEETPVLPQLAPVEPEAPAEVASIERASEPPPAAAVAEGYVVQLSSQRTDAQARSAFADLQRRYPALLGGLTPDIREADLGAKGIFYRVRVGPWASRSEAIGVCESLQAAGGSCFVTR